MNFFMLKKSEKKNFSVRSYVDAKLAWGPLDPVWPLRVNKRIHDFLIFIIWEFMAFLRLFLGTN